MADEQSRGRRRPSREYHSSEAPSTSRRPREPSITEEPVSLKKSMEILQFCNAYCK